MADPDQTREPAHVAAESAEDVARKRRLDELSNRIEQVGRAADGDATSAGNESGRSDTAGGKALRIGTEFIAGVAVGSFIGYWMDRTFGTWPLWFVVFFLLGMGAGFLNVMRTARQIQAEMPDITPEQAPHVPDEEDDDNAQPTGADRGRSR